MGRKESLYAGKTCDRRPSHTLHGSQYPISHPLPSVNEQLVGVVGCREGGTRYLSAQCLHLHGPALSCPEWVDPLERETVGAVFMFVFPIPPSYLTMTCGKSQFS